MWQSGAPDNDIIRGIYSLFSDNLNVVRTWGFYLFSPEFDSEPELRNRIGTIWLTSLLDSLEGELRSLETYRTAAAERGLAHLQLACAEVAIFTETVKEILRLYTRDEQLFLSDFRDQSVHSWLARRHVEQSSFKYFDGSTIVKERIANEEHAAFIRPFYTTAEGLDPTVFRLMQRFRNFHLRYWHVVSELCAPGKLEQVQAAMLNGEALRVVSLRAPIRGPALFTFN